MIPALSIARPLQTRHPLLLLSLAAFWLAAAVSAGAAGWAPTGSGAVLGQRLDFSVQLRMDAGETLAPECVRAEVTAGDRRLADSVVRTSVEMIGAEQARVRVNTLQAMEEPVIGILVHAGCVSRVTRRYVVMAEPPESRAPVAANATAAAATVPVDALRTTPAAQPSSVRPVAGTGTAAVPAAAARRVAAREADTPAQRQAGRLADRTAERRNARRTTSVAVATAPAPRLKLDPIEPSPAINAAAIVEQAIEAVAEAASAARASAAAASVSAGRIAALERTVDTLRRDAKAQREQDAVLRQRLAATEDGNGRWTWPLVAAVVALSALSLWLALRMRATLRLREEDWLAAQRAHVDEGEAAAVAAAAGLAGGKQATAPIPFVTSELAPSASARARPAPAWPPPAAGLAPQTALPEDTAQPPPLPPPPASPAPRLAAPAGSTAPPATAYPYDHAMQRADLLPKPQPLGDAEAARDVTIDELIDLEQQAEFFVVLGQDEAAVDLLVDHLRQSGGGSPLPYLKLLEIYRRRGDRDDYERTRTRFNHRFNAFAPDWDADLQTGRALEAYPGILPRLQQLWGRPLDAMAELEALLFRRSSRGELFELPAYREVLFLYALARDLLDREGAEAGNVDLLLPMADGGQFSSTSPAPFDPLAGDNGFDHQDFDARPTAPVDFDLSAELGRATSIFDPLDAVGAPPPRH